MCNLYFINKKKKKNLILNVQQTLTVINILLKIFTHYLMKENYLYKTNMMEFYYIHENNIYNKS